MSARHELGRIIWETSHRDEGTISATGANIVADAILAAGYTKPKQAANPSAKLIELLRRLLAGKPQRHYPSHWDGTHATCACGHHSVWDWDLRKHFEQTGRIGQ